MRNIQLLLISLFLMSIHVSEALSGLTTIHKCEDLGYTTPYDDCISQGGTPLVCPFYSLNEQMTICLSKSCRGYDLTEEDLNTVASDSTKDTPKTIRDHIKELEECETGFGNDKVKYYRVKECKEGSVYTTTKNNNICEVGCLASRYPYEEHPGDLAGDVDMCVDAVGDWYGYSECNSGWIGGWDSTSKTNNPTGYCNFGVCDIQEYPYSRDPNISITGDDVNRGATLTCRIGSNTYYKYTNKDKDGNPLTENFCGLSSDNNLKYYTLSLSVCRKQCVFENCASTLKNETLDGYEFSYNEFTCTQKTKDCRVGDMAVFENVEAGVIVHLPTDSSDKIRIAATSKKRGAYCVGIQYTVNLPLPDNYSSTGNLNGKYNTSFLLKYEEERNKTLADANKFDFQVAKQVNAFAPSGCANIPVCKAGEWYHPAQGENGFIYDNRYLLYNAMNNSAFMSGQVSSSSEYYDQYMDTYYLSGSSFSGSMLGSGAKNATYNYYPMISIYVR